ncbi:MAG: 30S ribosomal protein S10 [Candidatus Aenigmatarchaeota archaeon]|nr:30S ribosomal protein S10 [Candidatus Aenigmarchaeota archaeon]
MDKVIIKLASRNLEELQRVTNEIISIAKKHGIMFKGPIPLPTKRLKVYTMANIKDGTGHGNATWEVWEMRIHKRLIYLQPDERVLKQIMRIDFGNEIDVKIKVI